MLQHGNLSVHFCSCHPKPSPHCLRTLLLGFFPSPGLPTSNPSPSPGLLHFSKPSSHLVFPKLTNLPPSNRIPRAWGVGSRTHAQHPSTNQRPPAPTSALHAGGPVPHPQCLCSLLALMLGNPRGMPRPLPAYLNPPNSSKTSSRPSPLCAAADCTLVRLPSYLDSLGLFTCPR